MGRIVRESAGQFRKEAGYFYKENRTLQVKRQDTTGKKIEYYRNEESKKQEGSKDTEVMKKVQCRRKARIAGRKAG
jgi:hypothetical protein